ncbi:glucose-6-phosphate dehydrogenase [Halalkalibacterium ligniniphilum]|uniref:glucose-6-phosphate dehydrogenase n=1 Tax=Halalkalibacterium ligniniphilum TaxID=1134413 RepID=UPI00034AC5A2|nr:glucose-6-phosphate dehydrogenase [Halalkalibacterium ligniniphilum]
MESMSFILFGATGDLAKRKIYPALYNLFLDHKMPTSFSVIGVGRREWAQDEFKGHVKNSLTMFSRRYAEERSNIEGFLKAFCYQIVDVTKKEDFERLRDFVQQREEERGIAENRMFYLSVAPEFFEGIASHIKESGLGSANGWKRLIIEKPFGHDVKSANELNDKLSKAFEEDEIYRIDHYLGKPMVQNLEALEFANPILQAVWNNQYIANVQITASETVGVEERAGYYDQAGAIRDMVQNHMLQMLMMTAMNMPKQLNARNIRHEKKSIMESLRFIKKEEVASHIVRGQYEAGEIGGEPVVGYKEEPGISASSTNDTFVAARLWIDNDFWRGVPFYIRTGKRMAEKSTKIVIEFKSSTEDLYGSDNHKTEPNLLVISITPNEGISFRLNSRNPLKNGRIEPVTVDFSANTENVPEAYESLLFDALRGDSTFFAHWNEVELSWKWVQPVLEAFEEDLLPLHPYRAGSMGPAASKQLLAEEGFKWW